MREALLITLNLLPPTFSRPHVQRWFLPLPDVRRERSSILGPAGTVSGDGPASGPLFHQLLPQHLPDRPTVWREVICGDVPTGPAVWMQVLKCVEVCEDD